MPALPFPVVAIADHETLGPELVETATRVAGAGLRWVCLRAKGPDVGTRQRVEWGRDLLERCPRVFLTVHGDPEACEELRAPGLHLPSGRRDLEALRRRFPGVLLGVSCHDRADLEAAARAGADYAFLSPVFRPSSKPLRGEALGLDGFRSAVRGVSLPVLALGGISPERLAAVAAAGAAGAAVLGGVFRAPDLESRARAYRQEALRVFASPATK